MSDRFSRIGSGITGLQRIRNLLQGAAISRVANPDPAMRKRFAKTFASKAVDIGRAGNGHAD